jgi:hypothetical protein
MGKICFPTQQVAAAQPSTGYWNLVKCAVFIFKTFCNDMLHMNFLQIDTLTC